MRILTMTDIKMNELHRVDSEVLFTQMTEEECVFISGGIDLKQPAEQIVGVIAETSGNALEQGIKDLFNL